MTTHNSQKAQPSPALKRLEKLVGTWTIAGRTLDSDVDNIKGRVALTGSQEDSFSSSGARWNSWGRGLRVSRSSTTIPRPTFSHRRFTQAWAALHCLTVGTFGTTQ